MMQSDESTVQDADPLVTDAVESVRDRFGAAGLSSLIALAQDELVRIERAEAELAAIAAAERPAEVPSAQPLDAADTQAWLAYTEVDEGQEGDRRL